MENIYKLSNEQELKIIETYQNTSSKIKDICMKYGITESMFWKALRNHNVKPRTESNRKYKFSKQEMAEMISMYDNGEAYIDICKKFDIKTIPTLRKILNKAGVKIGTAEEPRVPKGGYPDQLCWKCAKAIKGCSWSRDFEPVEGWTAQFVERFDGDRDISTYSITACPEFVGD